METENRKHIAQPEPKPVLPDVADTRTILIENKNIMKREIIEATIKDKSSMIDVLRTEILELKKQALLLSDDKQQYKEATEILGKGKNKREVLVGRIYWKEEFLDANGGKSILIERSRAVMVDGEFDSNVW